MIQPRHEALSAHGLQTFFVVFNDPSAQLPDADYCATVRDRAGLTMPVLYDADGLFAERYAVTASELNMVLDEGAEVTYRSFAGTDGAGPALREALGLPPDADGGT